MCNKRRKRNIFNLIRDYNCEQCPKFKEDKVIRIGINTLYIYYIFTGCAEEKIKEWRFLVNMKLQRILYDYLLSKGDELLIWLEDELDLEKYFDELECLFINHKIIHIIFK